MKQKRAALSQKDIKRIKVLELVVNGMVTNQEAAESLKLCRRQIIRLGKKYLEQGETGIVHGNRGRHPLHRIGEHIRLKVLGLYRERKLFLQGTNLCPNHPWKRSFRKNDHPISGLGETKATFSLNTWR